MTWKDPDIRPHLDREVRLACAREEMLGLLKEARDGTIFDSVFAMSSWQTRVASLVSLIEEGTVWRGERSPERSAETTRIPLPRTKVNPNQADRCLECGHPRWIHNMNSRCQTLSCGCRAFAEGEEPA